MARKTIVHVVGLAVMLALLGVDLKAQKRISFRRGSSSATVRGKIGAKGYLEYLINGQAGQVMSIEITSGNNSVIVIAGTASGKSFSLDMTGGDHLLSVVNTGRSPTNYTLTVSIR